MIDSSYEGVKRFFVLAYDNTASDNQFFINSFKKHFLSRVKREGYNIKVDGRIFYDQSINDSVKQYNKVRKISTGQGDDYTAGCLLDYKYFKDN